ncbi:hypothetical protein FACS189459_1100 [Bacilli bacterium]|nr:hypothetical protein FACS189459_1100 [Bacilli bacterium]
MMKKDGKYTQKDYDEIDQKEKNDIKKNQDQLLSLTECLESDSDSHTHYVKYEINVKKDDMLLLVSDGVYN